ncbi:acyl--CoA ligase [bacterium]|nr:acyl--CoA ligase [bacterium]
MSQRDWFDKKAGGSSWRLQDWGYMLPDDQFNAKTSCLARRIAEWVPHRRTRIGLWGANSLDYLAALFAILRSGNVAVPMNTRLTARELLLLARQTDLSGIFVARDFPKTLRDALSAIPTFSLASRPEDESAPAGLVRIKELGDNDVAVLISSSGSTGQPKIVPLTLRSLMQHSQAVCSHLQVTWRDTWVVCLPFFHVGGLTIPFRCLVSGASLRISQTADPEEIIRLIDDEEATLVSVVPTMFERMLNLRGLQPFPKSLRAIIVGGGPVHERLLARCEKAYATYGLTEAGSMITCARPGCGPKERATAGPPLPGTHVRIVNEKGKEVGKGQAGRIAVRGPGMARGYIADSESNKETFDSGWILTEDYGRLDENGFLHVEGRLDDLMKSGGESVAPAEIEKALLEHPRIAAAVVMSVTSEEWGQSPAALIVLKPGRPLQKIHIYQFLEGKLARYKFPKTVVFTDKLPLLGNGKPDLKAIRRVLEGK